MTTPRAALEHSRLKDPVLVEAGRRGALRRWGPPRTIRRFWSKVDVEADTGCWPWMASRRRGYGRFRLNGRMVPAHRVAYELALGPIPAGLTIDHLCRNPSCVRPSHLEPVTERVNILRSNGRAAHEARRTACPQGHPYDEVNTRTVAGKRYCRTCQNAARKRRHAAARLAVAP